MPANAASAWDAGSRCKCGLPGDQAGGAVPPDGVSRWLHGNRTVDGGDASPERESRGALGHHGTGRHGDP